MAEEPTSVRAPKGVVFRRPSHEVGLELATHLPVPEQAVVEQAVVEQAVAEQAVPEGPVDVVLVDAGAPASMGVPDAELPMGNALTAKLDSIQADIAARPRPAPARAGEGDLEPAVEGTVGADSAVPESLIDAGVDQAAGDVAGVAVDDAQIPVLDENLTPDLDSGGASPAEVQVPPLIRAERVDLSANQPPPLGLEELVHRFGEMMWLEARLYEVVGYWATVEQNNDVAVLFAEVSRHHGWHAELWASAMPEVQAFDINLAVRPPHNGWVEFFQTLVEMKEPDQTAARVAALALVADPWIQIRNEQLSTAANAVSDRAIQRIQRFVLIDHDEDHERLIKALTYLPGGPVSDVAERLFPLIGESH